MKVENPVADEIPSAKTFLASSRGRFNERDLNCLAEAIYHEARGESTQGQAAVAEVILNRVESRQFPPSVCGVVNQPSQFSYTIGGKKKIGNKAAYLRARDIARNALAGAPRVLTGGATYFHTPAVRPSWSHRFQRTVRIGQHIFYRPGGQRVASN
ncbi:cell wall hydrolase [Paracoccus aerius]